MKQEKQHNIPLAPSSIGGVLSSKVDVLRGSPFLAQCPLCEWNEDFLEVRDGVLRLSLEMS